MQEVVGISVCSTLSIVVVGCGHLYLQSWRQGSYRKGIPATAIIRFSPTDIFSHTDKGGDVVRSVLAKHFDLFPNTGILICKVSSLHSFNTKPPLRISVKFIYKLFFITRLGITDQDTSTSPHPDPPPPVQPDPQWHDGL